MIRKHLDIVAIAVLVALLATGGRFAPVLAPLHAEAHQEFRLAVHEAGTEVWREVGNARMELIKAENDLVQEAASLRRELSKLPACPLTR
jgi:hypothetical protein